MAEAVVGKRALRLVLGDARRNLVAGALIFALAW
jgi:hypothetical protein